jgi:hypothetical protein
VKNSSRYFFKGPAAQVICVTVALGFVAFALVWIRAYYGSMRAYEQAEGYLAKHQQIKAITFLDRSIHWYTPLNPYVAKSAQRLWEICEQAEQRGDVQLALIAARTIRRGFLGVRSFYVPGKDWINRCDKKIAALMSKALGDQDVNGDSAVASSTQQVPEPDLFWTLILEVGLLGWIGSTIGFLMHGMTKGQTPMLRSRPAKFWGIMLIMFYTLWILGMVKA